MGSLNQILHADAIHDRAQSQIDAARITQKSGNQRRAAEANLQRSSQALGNRRVLDAAGEQVSSISENIARNLDAASAGSFSQRIAASEELGASVAGAAAAGVGGSSVDLYNSTLRLNQALSEGRDSAAVASDLYAASRAKGEAMTNGVVSLDNTGFAASMDFTQYVDHKKMGGLSQMLALTGAAAATYYGGPQAGMAVLDVFQSQNDAANGNFGGAGAKMDSAVAGAMSGWKNYTSLAEPGKKGEAWGKGAWASVEKMYNKIKL